MFKTRRVELKISGFFHCVFTIFTFAIFIFYANCQVSHNMAISHPLVSK